MTQQMSQWNDSGNDSGAGMPQLLQLGGLAQLAERVLSMHEVSGSIPEFSIHPN